MFRSQGNPYRLVTSGRCLQAGQMPSFLICKLQVKLEIRDFPGGAVVRTPCSQCREPGFDPWSGN